MADDFKRLCESCSHQSCCTNFAPPIVFPKDIENLKAIAKSGNEFLKEIVIQNKTVKVIKKKTNSKICTFWDEEKMNCSIYNNRPFDCRMFPFDIRLINNKYHWIVYSCNPDSNWEWSEGYLKMLENDKSFPDILENISVFADTTQIDELDKEQKIVYVVLREISQS